MFIFERRARRAAQLFAELERQAHEELQARIDRGRPAPEEWERARPKPTWLLARPIRSRPLNVQTVRMDALPHPVFIPKARRTPVEP